MTVSFGTVSYTHLDVYKRQAVLLRERDDVVGVCDRIGRARDQGSAHLERNVTGLHLVAEGVDGGRRGADPDQASVDDLSLLQI